MTNRLRELASIGAKFFHDWQFDRAENIDDEPRGHEGGFDGFSTCPHPDCVLVRTLEATEQNNCESCSPDGDGLGECLSAKTHPAGRDNREAGSNPADSLSPEATGESRLREAIKDFCVDVRTSGDAGSRLKNKATELLGLLKNGQS